MMIQHSAKNLSAQQGSSLLEVLITILILSFGLLGIAALTTSSLQAVKVSQFQSVAMQLANEYADRMRGNARGVISNNYNMSDAYAEASSKVTVPTCATTEACTPAELAAIDKAEWMNNLRRRLPSGGAYVQRNGLSVDIWVMWVEPGFKFDDDSTLSVAATGGSQCPAAAVSVSLINFPACAYYRVSI